MIQSRASAQKMVTTALRTLYTHIKRRECDQIRTSFRISTRLCTCHSFSLGQRPEHEMTSVYFVTDRLQVMLTSHRDAGKMCLFRWYQLRSTTLPACDSSFSTVASARRRTSSCTSKLNSGPDFPRALLTMKS